MTTTTQIKPVFYRDEQPWFSANEIAEILGYGDPASSVFDIIKANPEVFAGNSLKEKVNGEGRAKRVLNPDGVIALLDHSKKSVQKQFVRDEMARWANVSEEAAGLDQNQVEDSPDYVQGVVLINPSTPIRMFLHTIYNDPNAEALLTDLEADVVTQIEKHGYATLELSVNQLDALTSEINFKAVNPAPPVVLPTLREQLNTVVRRGGFESDMHYQDVYNMVYRKIKEERKVDVRYKSIRATAKAGREISKVDILEELGMIGYAIDVATKVVAEVIAKYPKTPEVAVVPQSKAAAKNKGPSF